MRISRYQILFIIFALLLPSFSCQMVRLPLKINKSIQPNLRKDIINLNAKSGGISIQNYYNLNFISPIRVGSPSREFNVILDTGSANLWVPDSSIRGKAKNNFDCLSSQTCLKSNSTPNHVSLKYGQGYVEGYKVTENLNLGGLEIPEFSMILAVTVEDLTLANFDGIIGLSLGSLSPEFPTVLDRLRDLNLIYTTAFSMYLGDDGNSMGEFTGEIIFGGYDPQYALSEFQFVKVKTEKESLYWETDLAAVGFGSEFNLSAASNLPVIFDSGTSFLYLPEKLLFEILAEAKKQGISCEVLPAQGLYSCDCAGKSSLSDLVFYFDGTALIVPASSYILESYGTCILAIQPMKMEISKTTPIILGDVLLKNYYTLYSAHNYTVGFAKAAPVPHFPVWIVLLIIMGIIGVIIAIYNFRQKRRERLANGDYNAFNSRGVVIGGDSRRRTGAYLAYG